MWASVLSQVKKADLPLFGGQQILVHLRRIGKRKIDQDNLVGSAKAVIDGLRKCGAIRDDTEEFVILGNVSQRVVKKGETPRLKVELERA
ncbi:MAG: hypothetical protein JSU96_09140 [Acidobacteriota bacterium]|nr:MAG: hypothetical protein JSU96_09140 [Acidobacteriota bacterium]